VNHAYFEGIIMFFIVLNTLIMASRYDGIDDGVVLFFGNINYIFAGIFNVEMVLKLIGLGW